MPSSSESHRVKIGLFHPVLIKILINKEKRSAAKRQRAKYSAYSRWDCCTNFSFRCVLTTFCAVSFLLSVKCVLLCEKNAWFTEEIFNWLGGCVKHMKHGFECGADRYCILSSHQAMTVTMTVDTGTPPVYDGPPSSLFLKLCGDVESNPGPSTDELIEGLGRTLGIRLDTISADMQSLRTTITSMSVQISVLTERLQKKEEDVEEMKSRTKGLDGRLKKIEEEVEQQQITRRQDNIVFFGVPEKEGRESNDDCASTMVTLLNQHDPLRRWKSDDMARVQRLGKKERETDREGSGSGRPRPVLVRFVRGSDKRRLISSRTLRKELYKANVTMNDDLTVKQRDTLKQLRDDGWVAYYRGTRLITTRRQQAALGPGRSAEPTGRRDHEDPMSTMQPSQEDRRDDWQREDWPGLSPSRQQQTSIADDSEAGRGPSGDAETGAARSTPRSPGRGRGSPGSQRDDTGADEQHEGVAESSPVPAGGHRPRTRLQTHSSSDDRPMMSDGRQTQGRIDTMFQRHQHR